MIQTERHVANHSGTEGCDAIGTACCGTRRNWNVAMQTGRQVAVVKPHRTERCDENVTGRSEQESGTEPSGANGSTARNRVWQTGERHGTEKSKLGSGTEPKRENGTGPRRASGKAGRKRVEQTGKWNGTETGEQHGTERGKREVRSAFSHGDRGGSYTLHRSVRTGGNSPRPFVCVVGDGVGAPPLNFLFRELFLTAGCLKQPHVVVMTAAELRSASKYKRQNATHYWEQSRLYSLQGSSALE